MKEKKIRSIHWVPEFGSSNFQEKKRLILIVSNLGVGVQIFQENKTLKILIGFLNLGVKIANVNMLVLGLKNVKKWLQQKKVDDSSLNKLSNWKLVIHIHTYIHSSTRYSSSAVVRICGCRCRCSRVRDELKWNVLGILHWVALGKGKGKVESVVSLSSFSS